MVCLGNFSLLVENYLMVMFQLYLALEDLLPVNIKHIQSFHMMIMTNNAFLFYFSARMELSILARLGLGLRLSLGLRLVLALGLGLV